MKRLPGMRFFALPRGFTNELERVGLGPMERALLVAAWDFSASELTDGWLTQGELRRLPGWSAARAQSLQAAGFLVLRDGRFELPRFLDYNQTRAKAHLFLALQRAKASAGGRATGAGRDEHGKFARPEPDSSGRSPGRLLGPESNPDHQYQNHDQHHEEERRYLDLPEDADASSPPHNRRAKDSDWTGMDPKWSRSLEAWRARGLRHPPTHAQREVLWPIVDNRPNEAARWIREANSRKAADVVREVLDRWDAFRRQRRQSDHES